MRGKEWGCRMLISAVDALTCNRDLIAWIDSRCVRPNVGLRSLRVPFGTWQIQGQIKCHLPPLILSILMTGNCNTSYVPASLHLKTICSNRFAYSWQKILVLTKPSIFKYSTQDAHLLYYSSTIHCQTYHGTLSSDKQPYVTLDERVPWMLSDHAGRKS